MEQSTQRIINFLNDFTRQLLADRQYTDPNFLTRLIAKMIILNATRSRELMYEITALIAEEFDCELLAQLSSMDYNNSN